MKCRLSNIIFTGRHWPISRTSWIQSTSLFPIF